MATTIQNAMAKIEQTAVSADKPKSMRDYIKSMEGEIAKALPSVITPERFTRMVLSALSTTPKLGDCTPKSFMGAMMTAAQLGMEPNTPLGQAYLLPYSNKGVLEVQFQLGYKGMIDLAYRSGEVTMIQAHIVYANDKFEQEFGLDPKLVHVPARGDRGEMVAVYAMFKTKGGAVGFDVMTVDEIRDHAAKYSKAYSSSYSPWKTNFEEMAKKTVLKKVLKYAPLKSDFVRGIDADGTVKDSISDDMFSEPVKAYEAEYESVDEETGEVTNESES